MRLLMRCYRGDNANEDEKNIDLMIFKDTIGFFCSAEELIGEREITCAGDQRHFLPDTFRFSN